MSTKPELKFALRDKVSKRLVGFSTSPNGSDAEFCGEETTTLSLYDDVVWYAKTPEHAQWVLENPTPWYNSDYEAPEHSLEPEGFEVVCIETRITEYPKPSIPTFEEMMAFKYAVENPGHLALMLKPENTDRTYSKYDLDRYLASQKEKIK